MGDILQSILAFTVALGVLITFHEFGHYWVAKRCGVKILRFSIGFGRPLWRRVSGPDNTEFVLAAIPLGGYVKMLDEREGSVDADELPRAFNNKSLAQRVAIVSAGPLFNFIFAIVAYWLAFMLGVTGMKPIIGAVPGNTPAAAAGIIAGEQIIGIDGVKTATWNSVVDILIGKIIAGAPVELELQDARSVGGVSRQASLALSQISIDAMADGDLLGRLGLQPLRAPVPAIIGKLVPGQAAEAAGLQPGDEIVAVAGRPVGDWAEFVEVIQGAARQPVAMTIKRDQAYLDITITPAERRLENGAVKGFAGVAPAPFTLDASLVATESYALLPALKRGVVKTGEMSMMTLRILGKILTGQASVKNLSGPISIAHYAGKTAQLGLVAFLGFLAIISIGLGVLNLLPIPLLDGGHLFYYAIEFVKGSPVSDDVQLIGQQVGIVVLFGLMSLAFYNDILRLVE